MPCFLVFSQYFFRDCCQLGFCESSHVCPVSSPPRPSLSFLLHQKTTTHCTRFYAASAHIFDLFYGRLCSMHVYVYVSRASFSHSDMFLGPDLFRVRFSLTTSTSTSNNKFRKERQKRIHRFGPASSQHPTTKKPIILLLLLVLLLSIHDMID